jgi:hypothetical protein
VSVIRGEGGVGIHLLKIVSHRASGWETLYASFDQRIDDESYYLSRKVRVRLYDVEMRTVDLI